MTKEEIVDFEIGAFTELIEMINALGLPPKSENKSAVKKQPKRGKTPK